jgi:hypothetical protein
MPSLCRVDKDLPNANIHPTTRPVLVCNSCKDARALDRSKRLDSLRFGVCAACEKYFRQHAPYRDELTWCQCTLAGPDTETLDEQATIGRQECRAHDLAYYTTVRTAAATGRHFRRTTVRKINRRKKNPFAKQKNPNQRRVWTQPQAAHLALQAIPRCCCGTALTAARHNRAPPAGQQYSVRNCVRCCQFVYE